MSRTTETAAARVPTAIQAWEGSLACGWTAEAAWALIQADNGVDPGATDAADAEDCGLVAVVADGSRLTSGTEGGRIGRCYST